VAGIGQSSDVEALQKSYTTAYRTAQALEDKEAMKEITAAKDERKKAIQK
jgi:hypothetical protein